MSASSPIWIEVVKTQKVWVESWGVTSDEAMTNAVEDFLDSDDKLTGRFSHTDPREEDNE